MKKIIIALATAGLFGAAATAQANTVSFTASKGETVTAWKDNLSFGKFDTNLGTLNKITFDLSGTVSGSGKAESLDGSASTVTLSLESMLKLTRPNGSIIVITNPVFSKDYELTAFDGVQDYAGTSGVITGIVTASSSDNFSSTSTSDFALFSQAGGGTIKLALGATGLSNGSGAGNLVTQFNTSAAGSVKVTYDYTAAPVPEPETYAMLIGGLGLLGLVRRRAAKKAA